MHNIWNKGSILLLVSTASAATTSLLSSYDYVIVGGGVSGLTVANRLSANSSTTVLVIEAGQLDQGENYITIPGLAGDGIGTKYDWNLSYVSNPDAGNRAISIPQGKGVGGGSLINRMVFDRGSAADYNRWQTLGNSGWGWNSLLPYFGKSEAFTPADLAITLEWDVLFDPLVHGYLGPVKSSYAPFFWPSTSSYIEALKELDVHISLDGADGQAYGGFYSTHNQDPSTATRSDARTAYYNPVASRSNLHLLTGQQVTRLITESSSSGVRVTGVEFAASSASNPTTVNVVKEAILAAGALHTPQILQLSGIGDPNLLSQLNIPTVANVPGVGRNLQDHAYAAAVYSFDFPLTTSNLTSNSTYAAQMMELYEKNHTGPYADPTGDFLTFLPVQNFTTEASSIYQAAMAQTPQQYLDADTPSTVINGYAAQLKLLAEGVEADDQAVLEVLWADPGIFVLGLVHPFSRGTVRLASTDPFEAPLADSGLFHNPLDVQLLVEAIKYARQVSSTSALTAHNPFEVAPGAGVTSDADLAAYVQNSATTLYHPSGTCAAGPLANGGVVNSKFQVYGVQNLRVVDASVFPLLPATHIQSTVYALAELAASVIQ